MECRECLRGRGDDPMAWLTVRATRRGVLIHKEQIAVRVR
jgi:hypothetical protein